MALVHMKASRVSEMSPEVRDLLLEIQSTLADQPLGVCLSATFYVFNQILLQGSETSEDFESNLQSAFESLNANARQHFKVKGN